MIDDNQIVDFFLERNERALELSSEKYGNNLRYLADSICHDMATAEECENDTYLRAWNSIPPHEPRSYLYAFFAKITRFIALDRCKRELTLKRHADLVDISEEIEMLIPSKDDTVAEIEGRFLSQMISNYLRKIPEEKRNIFLRRYWYMDPIADIAKRYSISEGKVKTILFRVRGDLRIYLEKEGIEV